MAIKKGLPKNKITILEQLVSAKKWKYSENEVKMESKMYAHACENLKMSVEDEEVRGCVFLA